ncbi:hypothetical protein GGQ74_001675 [Desulfobaculum xiamenense]|uniref:CAAX prenyl protease 2/Lysostaphin resistance protein A-like domain-containing protein n=1 Tax=Desulfobaculum xiamenense TaxID=995050 RepID=A0A846QNG4_9BACT|nr:JDVT-CTERM system glutamic-type intramembrane protease [Desulfobaculum xiamenense]NJB68002.1 hypothetical protein [Desulfobaculum xiamenense]
MISEMPEWFRLRLALTTPFFWVLVVLGAPALLYSPGVDVALWSLPLRAFVEEFLFRGVVQDALERRFALRIGIVTGANLFVSLLFALAHLPTHPPLWAALTFLPSLAFGALWSRHRSVTACAFLHVAYNVMFFLSV